MHVELGIISCRTGHGLSLVIDNDAPTHWWIVFLYTRCNHSQQAEAGQSLATDEAELESGWEDAFVFLICSFAWPFNLDVFFFLAGFGMLGGECAGHILFFSRTFRGHHRLEQSKSLANANILVLLLLRDVTKYGIQLCKAGNISHESFATLRLYY